MIDLSFEFIINGLESYQRSKVWKSLKV